MKILIVSDIHSDYTAAQSAYSVESPDFVLDCGDHEEIKNIFQSTQHFYIHGNHEPSVINIFNNLPLPNKISSGQIIVLNNGTANVRVAGLDGNYADPEKSYSIKKEDIERLRVIKRGSLDIFLTHESPLLVPKNSSYKDLAEEVVEEIDRIAPKYLFSGHFGRYTELKTKKKVSNMVLDEMSKGYCVLDVGKGNYRLKRVRSRFR